MNNCCNLLQPKCFWCDKYLYKKGPTILFKFKGCGKYHNKIICNLCFYNKFGFIIHENYNLSNDKNNDPLGMNIYILKKI